MEFNNWNRGYVLLQKQNDYWIRLKVWWFV
jgi:hypothetical protein